MHGLSCCWLHPRLLLTHEKLRWRSPSEFSCACTPHVRGGSVSCRGLNQAAGNRAHLSGGTPYAEAHKPNASRSSGEGVWGRGASLREAASPPESPHRKALREGARGRGLLYREAPSLAKPLRPHFFREPGFFDAALQPVAAEVVDDEEQGRDRPCDGIAEEHEVNVVMTRRDKLHPNDAQ